MDFALSEEQQFLQSTITDFLGRECPLDKVRDCVDDSITRDSGLSDELAELGIPAVVVPEEHGGTEFGYLEAALIAEAMGGAVAPYPFLGPCVVAPYVLTQAGSDQQRSEWLPKIAAGDACFGIAFTESIGRRVGESIQATQGRLEGELTFVLDGCDADHLLVSSEDCAIHIVDVKDVEITALKSIDRTRSLAQVKLDSSPAEVLPGSAQDSQLLRRAIDVGRIMIAADTLGAAQTMLDKAVAYAGERMQFNRVIGSFQAVKHMCAEMAAELEPCRSLVWYAAHSVLAIPSETRVVACHAKAHLSEVGQFVARKATEVHGGMGFTDLLGLHYWFKRVGLNRQLLGTPDQVREEAAQIQGW